MLRNASTINKMRIKESILIFRLGYRMGSRGFMVCFPEGSRGRSFLLMVQTGSRFHPASYSVGARRSSPGDKWSWSDANHSAPSSADVKINWSCTSTSPHAFYGVQKTNLSFLQRRTKNLHYWQMKSLVWIWMLRKLSIISYLVSRMHEKMATWRECLNLTNTLQIGEEQ